MTSSIPFEGVKDTKVVIRVIQGDLPSITVDARMSLIQALCSLMIRCWSIDSFKRPTAAECRKEIEWMASHFNFWLNNLSLNIFYSSQW